MERVCHVTNVTYNYGCIPHQLAYSVFIVPVILLPSHALAALAWLTTSLICPK